MVINAFDLQQLVYFLNTETKKVISGRIIEINILINAANSIIGYKVATEGSNSSVFNLLEQDIYLTKEACVTAISN